MVDTWMVETDLSDEWDFYTRANVGEVFPDPVAPLSFSYFQNENGLGGSEVGFREAYYRIGAMDRSELPTDQCVFIGVTNGYTYLNASALRMLGHRAPGMTAADIDAAFFGDSPGVPEFVVKPGFDRPDLTEKIGETFGWALTTPNLPDVLRHEELVDGLRASRPDFASMTDRQLVECTLNLADTHFETLFEEHIFVTFLASLPMGIITAVCTAVGMPTATLKLIAGLGDVESAAPSMEMWKLGRLIAASPALGAIFDAGNSGLDGRLRADGSDDAKGFVEAFDEFLYHYGCRGPNEWETRSPTWETHPNLALAAIDRIRLSPESSAPSPNNAARAAEREAIGAEITAMLAADPETQGQFQAALHSATVFMPGRERTKTNCVKLIQEMRMALQEFGHRCVAAGTFPRINSYGMLTRTELVEFLDDPASLTPLLEQREALYNEYLELQEPFLFVGVPGDVNDYPRRDSVPVVTVTKGELVQGVAGCPGIARGIARVVISSHDPTALAPGDILIAPITDPSWTPLFVPAAGVVVDVGAPLSHAIIVSRELGIPCVVSATDATKRIPDGTLIEVDGNTGIVTIIELPA